MISAKFFALCMLVEIILALAIIAWLCWMQARERENLYSRIQAGSLTEYTDITSKKPPPKGGNMVTAGLKKAARQEAVRAGDD